MSTRHRLRERPPGSVSRAFKACMKNYYSQWCGMIESFVESTLAMGEGLYEIMLATEGCRGYWKLVMLTLV